MVSVMLGSVILGLSSLPGPIFVETVLRASTDVATLETVAATASIAFLNAVYQSSGKFEAMSANLGKIVLTRGMLAVIPAIFGVLPVQGGALFSAPLVDSEGDKLKIGKDEKAFLNIWFRHIPHLLYPLETALVVTAYLTNVDLVTLIGYQIPVFVVGLMVAYLVGLRRIEETGG